MPIVGGPKAGAASIEYPAWGLARFKKGQKHVTTSHYHDCDEWVFMIEGKMLMRSEGVDYVLEPKDVLVTRMGDEHEIPEIIEDTAYFWCCTELRGQMRKGHLTRTATA